MPIQLVVLLAFVTAWAVRTGRWPIPPLVVIVLATVLLIDASLPVVCVGLLLIFVAGLVRWRYGVQEAQISDRSLLVGNIAILVVIAAMSNVMWLPAERVTMADGSVRVAFVLTQESGTYVLLNEKERTVDRVPVDDVTERELCAKSEGLDIRLRDLWNDDRPYPECDTD